MEQGNQKLVLVLVIVVGLVAIAACIIGAVALSRDRAPAISIKAGDSGSSSNNNGAGAGAGMAGLGPGTAEYPVGSPQGNGVPSSAAGIMSESGRITYNIMVGHDYGAFEYINEGGFLTGFHYDLISEVCSAARINCRTIWDSYNNCWDSEPGQVSTGGEGLMDRWYDACIGYYPTVERIHVFDFSMPYLKMPRAHFYVKKGNMGNIDTSDITGKNIGFIAGYAADEKCLAREENLAGNMLAVDNIKYAPNSEDVVALLIREEVDAVFTTHETMEKYLADGDDTVEVKDDRTFSCFLGGDSLMTRKDNGFSSLWNKGFQELRNNGKLKKLCDMGQDEHGHKGTVDCII